MFDIVWVWDKLLNIFCLFYDTVQYFEKIKILKSVKWGNKIILITCKYTYTIVLNSVLPGYIAKYHDMLIILISEY